MTQMKHLQIAIREKPSRKSEGIKEKESINTSKHLNNGVIH